MRLRRINQVQGVLAGLPLPALNRSRARTPVFGRIESRINFGSWNVPRCLKGLHGVAFGYMHGRFRTLNAANASGPSIAELPLSWLACQWQSILAETVG